MTDVRGWTDSVGQDLGIAPSPNLANEWNEATKRGVTIHITTGACNLVMNGVNTLTGGIESAIHRGIEHHRRGELTQAIACFNEAVRINPLDDRAIALLGSVALENVHLDDPSGANLLTAIALLEQAAALNPNNEMAVLNVGAAYMTAGRLDDALRIMRDAIDRFPHFPVCRSSYLFSIQSHPDFDENIIAEETETLWRKWSRETIPAYDSWLVTKHAGRTLRVAYVSPDIDTGSTHPMKRFMDPILAHHTDAVQVVLVHLGYGVGGGAIIIDGPDTAIFANIGDYQLATELRNRKIDIVVDLAGHTHNGRPMLFGYRPAPVSIYYLSLPGDAGTCDYYLTDLAMTPHPERDPRAIVLDSYWLYTEPKEAGEPSERDLQVGIIYSAMGNFHKVTDEALRTWKEILERVPGSRLNLFCPPGPSRQRVWNIMGETGTRINFFARQSIGGYFKTLQSTDIVLDTWPCNNGTVTMDSLWCGRPGVSLVTMVGDKPVGRGGASIGGRFSGLACFARTTKEYVDYAVDFSDRHEYTAYAETCRVSKIVSRLMDAKRFIADLEGAYRKAWMGYCER